MGGDNYQSGAGAIVGFFLVLFGALGATLAMALLFVVLFAAVFHQWPF